jgi:hypothetical protein
MKKQNDGKSGTWTIRPDDDVRAAVEEVLKVTKDPKLDRSKLINSALALVLGGDLTGIVSAIEARKRDLDKIKETVLAAKRAGKAAYLAGGSPVERVEETAATLAAKREKLRQLGRGHVHGETRDNHSAR